MEDGNYLLIELFSANPLSSSSSGSMFTGKKNSEVSYGDPVAWHIYPIKLQTINSEVVTLEFFKYPPDRIVTNDVTTVKESDSLFLDCEISVSKKAKLIDLGEYRNQPYWANHLVQGDSSSYASDFYDNSGTGLDMNKFLGI